MIIKKLLSVITIGCILSLGYSGISLAKEPVKKQNITKNQKKSSKKITAINKTSHRNIARLSVDGKKRIKAVMGAGAVASAGASLGKIKNNSFIYSLMDLRSGEYLESSNLNQVHSLASLTKLMSSYVFVKNHPNLDNCYISVTDDDKDSLKNTRTRVQRDTPHTCNKILQAVLVMSDNWAASALSKSLPNINQNEFIKLMNKQAKIWGMRDTTFSDPAGLNPKNKSTANDLNILISQVVKNNILTDLSTRKDVIFFRENGEMKTFQNTNMLIRQESFASNLSKTGYINESGYNLVFVPEQCDGNKNLALVIMGAQSSMKRASFAKNILNKYHCS